jgi:hypothetical protein
MPQQQHPKLAPTAQPFTSTSTPTINPSTEPINAIDRHARLQEAKEWLDKNPEERISTASRIFKVNQKSLCTYINRTRKGRHGGHNKILGDHQVRAIHTFIRELLSFGIQPTYPLIYKSICLLKQESHPNSKPPSKSWMATWWKKAQLHKIKSKPLAAIRITAQQEKDVEAWFKEYRKTLIRYKIQRRNILNFDEAGFRIGCLTGQEILVPEDILEVSYLLFNSIILTLLAILS